MKEVVAREAFTILHENPDAVLIDVRTPQEWALVGAPMAEEGRAPFLFITWQVGDDQGFITGLEGAVQDRSKPLLFLCRSGMRSLNAAHLAELSGYKDVTNIVDGFEDAHGPGTGWRAGGLPWDHKR